MSARAFGDPQVKAEVSRAVSELETKTAAEIVVSVQPSAGFYRHADYLFGALVALVVTLIFVFHPRPFRSELFPIELALAFGVGAGICASWPALRRRLVSRKLLRQNVELAARAAFVELGVDKTRARTGMLIFVSMFERDVAVVLDSGIELSALGADWPAAVQRLRTSARDADPQALIAALRSIGPILAQALPCPQDDSDELPNEPRIGS